MKKLLFILLIVIVLLAGTVFSATAAGPELVEFDVIDQYPMFSCQDFDVVNHVNYHFKLKFFYDEDGGLDRVHQHWSGADVLTNSVSGNSITSTFTNYAVFDDISSDGIPGTVLQAGVFWKVNQPGGLVWFEAGQYDVVLGSDGNPTSLTFEGASNLDTAALCSLLAD